MGIRPFAFLLRVLCFFGLTFAAWPWVAQPYTRLLAALSAPVVSLLDRPMQLWAAGTTIHFWPSGYAIPAQVPGVPAEWIQANLLLLLPLMEEKPTRFAISGVRQTSVHVYMAPVFLLAVKLRFSHWRHLAHPRKPRN